MNLVEHLLRGLLIVAGLLLPGAGWALAIRAPLPGFAAGVISLLLIFAGVVGLPALGVSVSLLSLAGWLGLMALAGGVCWRLSRPVSGGRFEFPREWWLAWPVLPLVLVAIWRAVMQPLSGVDADFRWDHLARLIVTGGNLDFYPPVSAEDFGRYFWVDGIAPLVSGVYAWTYLAAGSSAKIWTAIPVLMQAGGLLAMLFALARQWQPEARAGWFACALAGGTMLLQFAFNLGQETGLTTLGAGGMVYYLSHWQSRREIRLLVPAACCAGLAACAREYGAFCLLAGLVWLIACERGMRSAWWFLLIGAVWPGLWHLRVWSLTGNPLYPHDLAGLFPVNPVFRAWMQGYVDDYGQVWTQLAGWREFGRLIAVSCLPAVLGLIASGVGGWRRPGTGLWWLLGAATVFVWLLSIPFTAGGLFYSMRVLGPLLLLGCAAGGAVLAGWVPQGRYLAGLLVALGLFATDASLRALTMPRNPHAIPAREWLSAGAVYQEEFARESGGFVEAAVSRVTGRVLSDSAGLQSLFQQHGRTLLPLWSPDVRFLFEHDDPRDAAMRLRELGYSHVLFKRAQSSADFLTKTGVLKKLEGRLEPVMANDTFIMFALKSSAAKGVGSP